VTILCEDIPVTYESPNNGQLLRAQIGPRKNKAKSRALLLSLGELPGAGWLERVDKLMRMGVLLKPPPFEWIARAGKAGHFSAVRVFEQSSSHSELMVQVLPLVSHEDAALAMSDLNTQTVFENPNFHGSVLEDHELPRPIFPDVETARSFFTSWDEDGQVDITSSVHLQVGTVVLVTRFVRRGHAWTEDEMLAILEIQISKLKI
jgi:hypothetical protein